MAVSGDVPFILAVKDNKGYSAEIVKTNAVKLPQTILFHNGQRTHKFSINQFKNGPKATLINIHA